MVSTASPCYSSYALPHVWLSCPLSKKRSQLYFLLSASSSPVDAASIHPTHRCAYRQGACYALASLTRDAACREYFEGNRGAELVTGVLQTFPDHKAVQVAATEAVALLAG
jgi:hypothetical protein